MSAPRRSGFTLLEVLAAVSILGLVYTMLSVVAARWLGAEGEARRRMQASLLADRELAELEAQIAAGSVPPSGENETTDESQLYRVVTRVQDFPLPLELGESSAVERPASTPTLFPAAPGAPTYLRLIEVSVAWDEAGQPLEARRTTLAFDLEAAAPVLAVIPRPEQKGGQRASESAENPEAAKTRSRAGAGTQSSRFGAPGQNRNSQNRSAPQDDLGEEP